MNKYINPDDLRQILIDNNIDHIQTDDLKEVIQIVDELPTITEQEIVKPYLDQIRAEIEAKCCITVGRENEPAITLHDVFEIIDKYTDVNNGGVKK